MSSGAGFDWSQAAPGAPSWEQPTRTATAGDAARGGVNPYGGLTEESGAHHDSGSGQQSQHYSSGAEHQGSGYAAGGYQAAEGSWQSGGAPDAPPRQQPPQQQQQGWGQGPQFPPATPPRMPPQNPQYPPAPQPPAYPQAPQYPPQQPQPQPQSGAAPAQPAIAGPILPIAQVFDGVNPDGSLVINRAQLDAREIPALAAYLTQAPIVLAAPGTGRDEMVAAAPAVVPRAYHSDGAWVWSAAVGYYLNQYQLPPQPELLAYIRARNYVLPALAPGAVQTIGNQVLATVSKAGSAQQAQPQPQPQALPQSSAPAPMPVLTSTPPPVQQAALPAVAPMPAVSALPAVPTAPFTVARFGEQFKAVGNRHAAWVLEQMEVFLAFLVPGEWTADRPNRVFRQAERQFTVEALGALSAAGVWTWAWSDPATWGADPVAAEQARRLRAYGEAQGIEEFANAALDLTNVAGCEGDARRAADMVAGAAMGALGARGYVGNSPLPEDAQRRVYYLVLDPTIPAATPTLGTLPRFLMDGPATFGGDTSDCVLGYVEHHGWRWSRLPDGIVVAAEGVGSFTVEVDATTGRMTGLSLHT